MQVQPYLYFDGRCDEAIEFYKSAFGRQSKHAHALQRLPGTELFGEVSAGNTE